MLDLLSEKSAGQRKALKAMHSGLYRTIAWCAPIRSAKTSGICIGLVERSLIQQHKGIGNGQSGIIGVTIGSMIRNTENYFYDVCKQYGVRFKLKHGDDTRYEVGRHKFFVFGGDKVDSRSRIQGMGLVDVWDDEATLQHEDMLVTAMQRRDFDESLLVLTMNAGSPYHIIKREIFDDPDRPYTMAMETDFYDNGYYSDAMREEADRFNPGSYLHKRNIGNLWAPATGACYDIGPGNIVNMPLPERPEGVVSLDWGGSTSTFAAHLLVPMGAGTWHVLDEYSHNGNREGILNDETHMHRILTRWQPRYWVVDQAALSFKALLMHNGQTAVSSRSDIVVGIENANDKLRRNLLTVDSRCVGLLREAASLEWNARTDKPRTDQPDDHVDSFRYGAMEVLPPVGGIILGGR